MSPVERVQQHLAPTNKVPQRNEGKVRQEVRDEKKTLETLTQKSVDKTRQARQPESVATTAEAQKGTPVPTPAPGRAEEQALREAKTTGNEPVRQTIRPEKPEVEQTKPERPTAHPPSQSISRLNLEAAHNRQGGQGGQVPTVLEHQVNTAQAEAKNRDALEVSVDKVQRQRVEAATRGDHVAKEATQAQTQKKQDTHTEATAQAKRSPAATQTRIGQNVDAII
jgi:hypothetical protein